jgi:hypothetical protein
MHAEQTRAGGRGSVSSRLGLVGVSAVLVAAVAAASAFGLSGTNVVTTYAGTTYGFSGDGGPATAAQLRIALDVAFDGQGNAYIVDSHRIRKVSSGGTITTVAGTGVEGFSGDGGPATSAKLNGPYGVAVDGQGNVYIADTYNGRVRKVDSTGAISTIAGGGTAHSPPYGDGGPATSATLWEPVDVVVDAQGNLYISEWGRSRVRKVDTGGTITTFAGGGSSSFDPQEGVPATSASLSLWQGSQLALDGQGNLYLSESYTHVVRKVDSAGIITRFAGGGPYTWYDGPNGFGLAGECGPATSASLGWASGLAADAAGNVYIATRSGPPRVRKVDPSGRISTVAGGGYIYNPPYGDGGAATDALLYVWGLALDGQGNLYVAAPEHYRVRKMLLGQTAVASQSIVFELVDEDSGPIFKQYGNPDFPLDARASSCLPLVFTTTGGCTVSAGMVHITGAGSCTITASQPGNSNYTAAQSVSRTFSIAKATQTIAFSALANKVFGDPDFAVGASASSGLPVAFTASGSRCTVAGATVHITSVGSCSIRANQPGNSNYNAAPEVWQTFTIARANQTIAFAALPDKKLGDPDFAVSANASSGLSVSYSASGQCRISGARVHLTGVGSCAIRASQSGNANYNAASPVSRTFSITKGAGAKPKAKTCRVPKVLGKRLAVAKRMIKQRGCRTGKVRHKHSGLRRGIVLSQSRRAGRIVPAGTRINLGVSRGGRR